MSGGEQHAVTPITDAQIETALLTSLARRAADSSCCPSEIARALAPIEDEGWRALMPRIRNVVVRLARENRVVVTRGSRVLSSGDLEGGPIRVRRGTHFAGVPDADP